MNESQFLELVKKKAHKNVQDKIITFKRQIGDAFNRLTGTRYVEKSGGYPDRVANYKIISTIKERAGFDFNKSWPAFLWNDEEDKVMKEILSTMDTMQKALVAPDVTDTDCMPEEAAE